MSNVRLTIIGKNKNTNNKIIFSNTGISTPLILNYIILVCRILSKYEKNDKFCHFISSMYFFSCLDSEPKTIFN